jgi:hypothetical protein
VYLTLSGCGAKGPAGMIPVTGRITLTGAPLAEGSISFASKDNGFSAAAKVVAGGFRVMLKPGEYAIAVVAQEELYDERGLPNGFRQLIPARYFTTATSGLGAVVDQQHASVAFDLAP